MPTMVEEKPFDTARDAALIKAGTHFYCQSHLTARPVEEQSEDPRYCRGCCEFLRQEAEFQHSGAEWAPKMAREQGSKKVAIGKVQDAPQIDRTPPVKGDIIPDYTSTPLAKRRRIMSTSQTSEPVTVKKRRGPKPKILPVKMIKRWAEKEEMGSKAIATRLGKERGIKVSYKTVQRILADQRQLGL